MCNFHCNGLIITFLILVLFIKVFTALGTETAKPSSAASCIAGIASAELPHNLWPDLLNNLCLNTSNEGSSDTLKEATLEAIGYICQDIVSYTFFSNYVVE